MDVLAEASTGADAVTRARALDLDVVVMDLHMPDLSVEATCARPVSTEQMHTAGTDAHRPHHLRGSVSK